MGAGLPLCLPPGGGGADTPGGGVWRRTVFSLRLVHPKELPLLRGSLHLWRGVLHLQVHREDSDALLHVGRGRLLHPAQPAGSGEHHEGHGGVEEEEGTSGGGNEQRGAVQRVYLHHFG